MIRLDDPQPLDRLVRSRRPGHPLPRGFYTREDVFARDLALLQQGWSCVGHVGDLAQAGQWITAELGDESAIVVRGADGGLRAFANVCRHRGSRICVGPRGSAATLVCPYHAWTYQLDGRLRGAREMPPGFDSAANGLVPLPLAEIGGLVFVSFADHPTEIAPGAAALGRMTARYGWPEAKVADRARYRVTANWKLALENYHECYHCGPAHPEFSGLHALARPGARRLRTGDEIDAAFRDIELWSAAPAGTEPVRVMRSALAEGSATGSSDGRLLAPVMGPDDGHCVFAELGLLSAFLAYADYGVIYRFIPKALFDTELEVIWLVRGDAEEGRDYDRARLTWLWDVTSQADKRIIETNQAGVRSRWYEPGPFSLMEPGAAQYVDHYVRAFSRLDAAGGDHGL